MCDFPINQRPTLVGLPYTPEEIRSSGKIVKIWAIGDSHGYFKNVMPQPDCSILIHVGDISFQGNVSDIVEYNKLMASVPLDKQHKLLVLGNHDERKIGESEIKSILTECTLLLDEEVTVDGLRIYGTRWTNPDYTKIPTGLDILVTHGAPYGLFDYPFFGERMGDKELLKNLVRAQPHLHLFGHNHDEEGYCAVRYKGADHWTLEANVNIIFGNCHSRDRVNPFKVYYCKRNKEGEEKGDKDEFYPAYKPYLKNRYDMETKILQSKYYEIKYK